MARVKHQHLDCLTLLLVGGVMKYFHLQICGSALECFGDPLAGEWKNSRSYYSCCFAKNLHRGSTIDASNIHIQSIQEHGFNFQNKIARGDWNAPGAIRLSCLIFTRRVLEVKCQSNDGSKDPGVTWRRTHKSKEICRKWIPIWSFN